MSVAFQSASTEAPLRVEAFGLRYRRGRPWAVRDVSFTVPVGAISALVGPNGAGKSTLLRSVVGFERPTKGIIRVFGVDPRHDPQRAVGQVGYVPQSAALYRNLTIADHFRFAGVARRSFDREFAVHRMDVAGLTLDRRVSQLSGGEQAQVALALALGTRAPLLILDEPLASLDPLARREFLATLVVDVRERHATAVLSSHIVTDVEQACDRILVLAGGRLVLDDGIVHARSRFRAIPAAGEASGAIGQFSGPDGDRLRLVSDPAGGASLEEVVLGHLASAPARGKNIP